MQDKIRDLAFWFQVKKDKIKSEIAKKMPFVYIAFSSAFILALVVGFIATVWLAEPHDYFFVITGIVFSLMIATLSYVIKTQINLIKEEI